MNLKIVTSFDAVPLLYRKYILNQNKNMISGKVATIDEYIKQFPKPGSNPTIHGDCFASLAMTVIIKHQTSNIKPQTSTLQMEKTFDDLKFEKIDFSGKGIDFGEYDNCNFINCNFSNADLSQLQFSECNFTACNLSLAKLNKTVFRDIIFKDCKLVGLHFNNCDDFLISFQFDNCIVDLSSFYKLKLKKIIFRNCSLVETDFTETDLASAIFDNCNLQKAVFENTVLEKADFRTSFNYSINPEINKIKKAKFSLNGVIGLLDKYDIEID